MAERKTRRTESAPRDHSKRKTKKKKSKVLPVVVTVLLLFVVFSVFGMSTGDKTADGGRHGIFLSGQPEFFSTIRPESMTNVEIDATDDMGKASAYFADSLFVGDTQMEYIQNAKLVNERVGAILSKALFLTADTYSWKALGDEFEGGALTFNLYGDYVKLNDALDRTAVKKVFLQVGREDLAAGDVAAAVSSAQRALLRLKEACPQVEIVVLPLTPNTADSIVVPSNNTIQFYNEELRTFCINYGFRFADTTGVFPLGTLPAEYCADVGDSGMHLNTEGSVLWVNALLEAVSAPQSTPNPTAAPTPATENPGAENQLPAADSANSAAQSPELNVAGRKTAN